MEHCIIFDKIVYQNDCTFNHGITQISANIQKPQSNSLVLSKTLAFNNSLEWRGHIFRKNSPFTPHQDASFFWVE